MCGGCCKEEFKLYNFGLEHSKPWLFVTAQWPWHPAIYLVYRIFFAIFLLTWLVLSGTWDYGWYTTKSNSVKWFIYITDWAFFMLTITAVVQTILVACAYFKRNKHSPLAEQDMFRKMPWYLKVNWVLYNIGANSAFAVTILYWTVIYDGGSVHVVSVMTHAANSIYVIIDLFVAGTPIRIYHAFHGMIVGVVYVVFSIIYGVAGGTNASDKPYIYEVLDWNSDLGSAALYGVLVPLVVVPLTWFLVYALYALRLFIYSKIYGTRSGVVSAESNKIQTTGETNVAYSTTE